MNKEEILNKVIKFLAMPILVTGGVASILFLTVGLLTMNVLMLLSFVLFLTIAYELICKIIIERTIE